MADTVVSSRRAQGLTATVLSGLPKRSCDASEQLKAESFLPPSAQALTKMGQFSWHHGMSRGSFDLILFVQQDCFIVGECLCPEMACADQLQHAEILHFSRHNRVGRDYPFIGGCGNAIPSGSILAVKFARSYLSSWETSHA